MTKQDDNERDEAFVERAARLFDDSVDGLDAATRSRLNRSRQRALDAAAEGTRSLTWQGWLPAGAAAAVAVVAVAMWSGNEAPVAPPPAAPVASDVEILIDGDSLDMLEELEFYHWMELDEPANDDDGHVG